MRMLRVVTLAVLLILIVTVPSSAAPGPKAKPLKVKVVARNGAFCPAAALVYGNVVIQAGRCYALFVLRTAAGTFLAFGPPGSPGIPPGQVVRLGTPAGAKVRGRIFYLIPIRTTAVLVPVDTITPVAVRVEDFGPRLTITLISVPVPNLIVIFNVQL